MSSHLDPLRPLARFFRLGLLLCLLPAAVRAEPPPSPYRVVDAMPTFWRYWEQARGLPEAEQVRLFREQVVAAHPELYTARVLGLDEKQPFEAELARRYPKYFQWVSPHFDTMRRLSEELRQKLPLYEARFRRTFPDLNYSGEISFMNSLAAFDGGTPRWGGSSPATWWSIVARVSLTPRRAASAARAPAPG